MATMLRRTFLALPIALQAAPTAAPPFHLGAVTYNTLKDLSVDEIIPVLERAGLEAVELRTGHKHGVEPSIGAEERQRVRRRFESSKVRLLSFGTTCRFQSPDPAERAHQLEIAKSFVDLAHDTGALGVKLQPMGLPPEVRQTESVRYFGASMRDLAEYAKPKGVEIWMEVHGKGTSDPPVAAALLKAAGHPNLGACWNSNPTDLKNGSVADAFRLLGPYIRNVHLHDLSDPEYPFREFFSLLRKAKYTRYTLIESPESKELDRFLRDSRALWLEMNRP